MEIVESEQIGVETTMLKSEYLKRAVQVDIYRNEQSAPGSEIRLLLFNDGQDLVKMNFGSIFTEFTNTHKKKPLVVVGIHCGEDRKNEYGMALGPDYQGLGAKAALYQQFVLQELLPFIYSSFSQYKFIELSFAGFSLGALSALDIVWNNAEVFSRAGVFSGSLWWRSLCKDDKDYQQQEHRMMHAQIRGSDFKQGLKFFFECGELDENEDRNKNGVIDSIDDTLDLMRELVRKGYREGIDMHYLQLPGGKHNVESWARAMPDFLQWGWG